jgi:beta-lactamase regulating signal transducer with metallopeptidase domain
MSGLVLSTFAQLSVERILNSVPEGILIAFFAWALLRVLRKQNSGTRFAVWFLVLLTVVALPMLGGFGEARSQALAGTTIAAISTPMSGARSSGLRLGLTIPGSWALFVFIAWTLGASIALSRLAAGLWRLRKLRQSCMPVAIADLNPAVRKTAEAIGASSGASSRLMIAASEHVRVPAALGFFNRTIVLPAWTLRELPPQDLNVIMLHEAAHLRRWDDWTNLIQKIVRALFFFHPAVWWIESRLSVEREMACDDAVLAETANPRGYATCLVSLLEKNLAYRLANRPLDKRWSMAQAAVHRAREASLRLAQILDTDRPVATRVWKPALCMVATFSVLCLAALPNAPQFVAFDRGASASHPSHEYVAAVSPSASQLLPHNNNGTSDASTQPDTSTVPRAAAQKIHRSHAAVRPPLSQAQTIDARLNAEPPSDRVVTVSASSGEETAPQFQTLVFIQTTVQTTRYLTPDATVWSVQVWRVTFVNAVRERPAGVAVSKSI